MLVLMNYSQTQKSQMNKSLFHREITRKNHILNHNEHEYFSYFPILNYYLENVTSDFLIHQILDSQFRMYQSI